MGGKIILFPSSVVEETAEILWLYISITKVNTFCLLALNMHNLNGKSK